MVIFHHWAIILWTAGPVHFLQAEQLTGTKIILIVLLIEQADYNDLELWSNILLL